MRWLPLSQPLLLQVVALALALSLLPLGAPAGRIDPRSGHINPPPGVPAYDPATWNGAWLLTLRNVPRTSELFPAAKGLDIAITDSCAAGDVSVLPGKGAKMVRQSIPSGDDTTAAYHSWQGTHSVVAGLEQCRCSTHQPVPEVLCRLPQLVQPELTDPDPFAYPSPPPLPTPR